MKISTKGRYALMIMIDLTEKLKINQNEISKEESNKNLVNENNITAETNEYKAKIKIYKDLAKKCKKSFFTTTLCPVFFFKDRPKTVFNS